MSTNPIPVDPAPAPAPAPISANGQAVSVTCVHTPQPDDSPRKNLIEFALTAVVGGTSVTWKHSLGSASGQIGMYDVATMQAEIDQVKQTVADYASKLELARLAAVQIK